jgi:hypothetical protein
VLAAYRRTGADLPFGDPCGYHGTGFEGYFWRITHAASGTVVVVLAGVNRDAAGHAWGTVGIAAHPGGLVRDAVVGFARASARGLDVAAADASGAELQATGHGLDVRLGGDRVHVRFDDHTRWPRRVFGGAGLGHYVPGLSQYWHPHLLDAGVSGFAVLGGRRVDLGGAAVYAEKNWGPGGFPDWWWWGQAHGFDRPDACVAFAGGHASLGPFNAAATALVVRLGDDVHHVVRPLMPLTVEVGEHGWRLRGRTARHRIELEGHANGTDPHLLPVPLPAERRHLPRGAAQHLAGHLRLRVTRGRRVLYAGETVLAGLERGSGLPARAARRERERLGADQALERADRQPQRA